MTSNNKKGISRNTNSSTTFNRSSNRPKPLIPKSGVTHSGRRTYSNGGKV